jgi:hypothetical protein
MPKQMEEALRRAGRKKGYEGERLDRFVYGIMNSKGYMRGSKTTKKGHAIEARAQKRALREMED